MLKDRHSRKCFLQECDQFQREFLQVRPMSKMFKSE